MAGAGPAGRTGDRPGSDGVEGVGRVARPEDRPGSAGGADAGRVERDGFGRSGRLCGGAGFFMGWLTLATAYFEAGLFQQHSIDEIIALGCTVGRRVLPLF